VSTDVQKETSIDDEINLLELIKVLWVDKYKIIAITSIFAVLSVSYALSIENKFKAEVLLVPSQSQSGGLAGAIGQLGGLASLAGVNIASGETSEVEIAIHIAKSWGFISNFVSENNLSVEVGALVGWNKETNELVYNEDLYDPVNNVWLLEGGPPSDFQLFKYFADKKEITEDKMTGLVSVSVDSLSPHLAKKWLDLYVASINEHMQQRKVTEVARNIKYLEIQLDKNENKEMQKVLYSIIGEQIKNKMVTEASPDYVFVPAGPSMLPQEKFYPKRAMISIWGTTLGGMLSVIYFLAKHFLQKRRRSTSSNIK
jgi:LPS O-antigen subunit length determinant protein (WzzB/FepE family)